MTGERVNAQFAQAGGGDPKNVYGCTSYVVGFPSGNQGCAGQWVDGNGNEVPENTRTRLGLMSNCFVSYQNGQVGMRGEHYCTWENGDASGGD